MLIGLITSRMSGSGVLFKGGRKVSDKVSKCLEETQTLCIENGWFFYILLVLNLSQLIVLKFQ